MANKKLMAGLGILGGIAATAVGIGALIKSKLEGPVEDHSDETPASTEDGEAVENSEEE